MASHPMNPRVFPGTVLTRAPGTLHGDDAEFLRQVSAELDARFVRLMTQAYDLKDFEFYREDMLDYLQGHPIHTVDDPSLDDADADIVVMKLHSFVEKMGDETRRFIEDLAGGVRDAAALMKRLAKLAERWKDVNVPLAGGRFLVLHPAAKNGLSIGRYDTEYFANFLGFAWGPDDVVPHAGAAGAHVKITVEAPRIYRVRRSDNEPEFPPACRDSVLRILFGSRACYVPVDIGAAVLLPKEGYFRLTPRGCARCLAPELYSRRLEDD